MSHTLIDAHCHLDKTLSNYLIQNKIPATINCQNKKEWDKYSLLTARHPFLNLSFGIHPWEADMFNWDEALPILKKSQIIGEIGLDNTWTNIPLDIQEGVFLKQLTYAYHNKKPVILHTKGMEEKISKIISKYPNKYLVHWYSSPLYLEHFIKLDCYFTVGPSLMNDNAVMNVLKSVPHNRILIESDGLSALSWALGRDDFNYLDVQRNLVKNCAKVICLSEEQFYSLIETNYNQWLSYSN